MGRAGEHLNREALDRRSQLPAVNERMAAHWFAGVDVCESPAVDGISFGTGILTG